MGHPFYCIQFVWRYCENDLDWKNPGGSHLPTGYRCSLFGCGISHIPGLEVSLLKRTLHSTFHFLHFTSATTKNDGGGVLGSMACCIRPPTLFAGHEREWTFISNSPCCNIRRCNSSTEGIKTCSRKHEETTTAYERPKNEQSRDQESIREKKWEDQWCYRQCPEEEDNQRQ